MSLLTPERIRAIQDQRENRGEAYIAASIELADTALTLYERVEKLERWKREAIEVLGEWEEVWTALGRPGRLGSSKAASTGAHVARLEAVVKALAESDPSNRIDLMFCVLCDGEDHESSCPWRMARELAERSDR